VADLLTVIGAAAVAVLVACAAPALAAPSPAGGPVWFWSVSKVQQGVGRDGRQRLRERVRAHPRFLLTNG
jgi:hypothetical protein